jgi:hypothetical protein
MEGWASSYRKEFNTEGSPTEPVYTPAVRKVTEENAEKAGLPERKAAASRRTPKGLKA